MSWGLYSATQKHKVVRAIREATYNPSTPQAILDTDTFLVLADGSDFNSDSRSMIPRVGFSPRVSGFKPADGPTRGIWSASVEVDFPAITGASNYPQMDMWLRAAGFQPTYSQSDWSGPGHAANAVNDDIQTYNLLDYDPSADSSVRILYDEHNKGASLAIRHDLRGARSNWQLNMTGGGLLLFNCIDGKAIGRIVTEISSPTTTSPYLAKETKSNKGVSIAMIELGGSAVYGGGSETAPSTIVAVRSLVANGNMVVQEDDGITGSEGVVRVRHEPTEPVKTTMVIEQTDLTDFNVWQLMQQATAIKIRACTTSPTTTSRVMEYGTTGVIMNNPAGEINGLRTRALDIWSIYPESGGDGGGLVPANNTYIALIDKN